MTVLNVLVSSFVGAGMYPAAEEYREFTEREIPLIVLEPA